MEISVIIKLIIMNVVSKTMTKRYDKGFKLHVVKQVIESNKPAAQVARELDLSNQTLCKWVQKYKEDQAEPFVGSGNLRTEDKAMRNLEKQLRDLKEENEILKKLWAFLQKT